MAIVRVFIYHCFFEATDEELLKQKKGSRKEAKAKPVATPVRTATKAPPPKGLQPSEKDAPSSGNPAAYKRMKGKTADPDKDRVIEELRKAGCWSLVWSLISCLTSWYAEETHHHSMFHHRAISTTF